MADIIRRPGEWVMSPEQVAEARAAQAAHEAMPRPVPEPADVDGDGLDAALAEPGPLVLVDGPALREALAGACERRGAVLIGTASAMGLMAAVVQARKGLVPLVVDCAGNGAQLAERTLSGSGPKATLAVVVPPGLGLPEDVAARCRVVRLVPGPAPGPGMR